MTYTLIEKRRDKHQRHIYHYKPISATTHRKEDQIGKSPFRDVSTEEEENQQAYSDEESSGSDQLHQRAERESDAKPSGDKEKEIDATYHPGFEAIIEGLIRLEKFDAMGDEMTADDHRHGKDA